MTQRQVPFLHWPCNLHLVINIMSKVVKVKLMMMLSVLLLGLVKVIKLMKVKMLLILMLLLMKGILIIKLMKVKMLLILT